MVNVRKDTFYTNTVIDDNVALFLLGYNLQMTLTRETTMSDKRCRF